MPHADNLDVAVPVVENTDAAFDMDRLDVAITALVEANQSLRAERDALNATVADRSERIGVLEGQLLDANQRRQDVAKRIDELIGQIDQLDAQLEEQAPATDAIVEAAS